MNGKLIITIVVALVIGYAIGDIVGFPDVNKELTKGDISKADIYSNQKEDPELAVIQEKLQNDADFLQHTQSCMSVLQERVGMLATLTEKTIELCKDIPELQEVIKPVQSLNVKAYNTNLSLEASALSLSKLASGNKAPEYEQVSNNAYVGFSKIESQMKVGKHFVEAAKKYLEKNKDNKLASVVQEWAVYSAQDAILNGNGEDMAYWEEDVKDIPTVGDLFSNSVNTLNVWIIIGLNGIQTKQLGNNEQQLSANKQQLGISEKQLSANEQQLSANKKQLGVQETALQEKSAALNLDATLKDFSNTLKAGESINFNGVIMGAFASDILGLNKTLNMSKNDNLGIDSKLNLK